MQPEDQVNHPIVPGIGVHSGYVMTVLGPVPVENLGSTLTHEHILCDFACNGPEPIEASRKALYHKPVSMEILGLLRMTPMINKDNMMISDIELAASEVAQFGQWGGKTIVEVTLEGAGRDPLGLQQVSRLSGVQIIMGAGYYIGVSHPPRLRSMSIDDIADEVVRDVVEGVPGTGVKAGHIGEIGIDLAFTHEEERNLRAAARAQKRTQVPLDVHLTGGAPAGYAERILDILEEEGAIMEHTLFLHQMLHTPDPEQQMAYAERGVFLGYDGISCNFDWVTRGLSPCDEENAIAIKRLIDAGYLHHILMSQDVHIKVMLTRYGGQGYAHIPRRFVNRLRAHGVTDEQIQTMLVDNPRRLFSAKHRSGAQAEGDARKGVVLSQP